jgi:hypothetical protein
MRLQNALIGLVALTLGPARAGEGLALETSYRTKCLGLYETVVPDGRAVYHSDGYPRNNFATRLDVLSGACENAGPVPSVEFRVRAVSADYLLVGDGLYNRHSIYRKSDWTRTGTLRLKDAIAAASIEGDTLYLVQQRFEDRSYHLIRFALPKMSLRSTQALDLTGDRVIAFGHTFLFADAGKLATLDAVTGAVQQSAFPVSMSGVEQLPGGQSAHIGCGDDARPVGQDAVMVHTTCHSYALFDRATLSKRYDIALADDAVNARGFVSGSRLYVLAESTTAPRRYDGVHHDIQVVDLRTGRPLASPPPLVSEHYTEIFQVEDRLIRAVYEPEASDFRVEVYGLAP